MVVQASNSWPEELSLDAQNPEVKEQVSFLDGSIQVPEVRHQLWRSWGFCPRHTWISAVVEIELRGGRPFGTTILYEDLTSRAVRALAGSVLPDTVRIRRLRSRGRCFTCAYLSLCVRDDPYYEARTQKVNRRERVAGMVGKSRSEWEPRSCPVCLGGNGPLCRLHLLSGETAPADSVAAALTDLGRRLSTFHKSMTWKGPPATATDCSSWIESLGWFAGWRYPAALVEAQYLDDQGWAARS